MAIKNEQAVQETATKTEAFLDKNKKAIAYGVLAIIVIVAGFFCYKEFISNPRETKASTAIARGQEYFGMEQYDKALNGDGAGYAGFVKIATDYSNTDAGNLANLYAGLSYAFLGKNQEALKYLDAYSASGDALVSPAAIAARGNVYAKLGKLDEAVKDLKKAASMADSKAKDGKNISLSPTFLLQAGIILESQGKKAEAAEIYTSIKNNYVNSMLTQSQEIDKYIERANQK